MAEIASHYLAAKKCLMKALWYTVDFIRAVVVVMCDVIMIAHFSTTEHDGNLIY